MKNTFRFEGETDATNIFGTQIVTLNGINEWYENMIFIWVSLSTDDMQINDQATIGNKCCTYRIWIYNKYISFYI